MLVICGQQEGRFTHMLYYFSKHAFIQQVQNHPPVKIAPLRVEKFLPDNGFAAAGFENIMRQDVYIHSH